MGPKHTLTPLTHFPGEGVKTPQLPGRHDTGNTYETDKINAVDAPCCAVCNSACVTGQLAEIRKFRYSKLLCANADFMPHIQPNVFFHPLSVVNDIVRLVYSQRRAFATQLLVLRVRASGLANKKTCFPTVSLNSFDYRIQL